VKPPLINELKSYDIFVVGFVWAAADHWGFSPWSIVLASAVTILVGVFGASRMLREWRRVPGPSDWWPPSDEPQSDEDRL
jgi:hypothetical protein